MKPWVTYSIVRLGIFAIVLAVLLVIGFDPLWAAVLAAVVGFCVSYIFFAKLRLQVASSLADRRTAPPEKDVDSSAEDDAIDGRDGRPDDRPVS